MTDQEIIELFFARDERAIVETEKAYGGHCMGVAMNVLGNRSDAEECVNDTWLKAWNAIPPQRPHPLRLFLTRIVRNLAISRYRANRAQKRNHALEVSLDELEACIPAPAVDNVYLRQMLNDFVGGLDELNRKLFVGRYWYAYDLETLSRAYGISANAIAQRLYRVREQLKAYLNEGGNYV